MNEIKKINKPNFNKLFTCNSNEKFIILPSHGDGSCFLHSIVRAITKNYENLSTKQQLFIGREYRKKFNTIITEQYFNFILNKLKSGRHAKLFEQNEYNYITFKQKFGDYKIWSDLIMISIFALRLNFNLIFYDSQNDEIYMGVENFDNLKESTPTIFIEWENHSHFNLIAKAIKIKNKIKIQTQFFINKDRQLIENFKKEFKKKNVL